MIGRFFTEHVEIEDLEDAERVHDEERDEPALLAFARGAPQREAFPNDRPNDEQAEEKHAADRQNSESEDAPRNICVLDHFDLSAAARPFSR